MRTTHEYKIYTNSQEPGWKLINKKAIEEGHTDSMDIYANDSFDTTWKDHEGRQVTSGYRLTKDRKSRVLITIINSYKKHIETRESVIKHIIMD
jgi:hypothetical protein